MKVSLTKVLGRSLFLIGAVGLLACGGVIAWFSSWRSDRLAALEASSEVVKTTAGPVEYATRGEGPVVIVFHAAPGGYDQAMLIGSGLDGAGFQILAPSRPGYLRTPLTTGDTPEKQADAMAALLDALGIDSVAVVGESEGSPAALEFARRYPARIWSLILVAPEMNPLADSSRGELPAEVVSDQMTNDMGSWFLFEMGRRDPQRALTWAAKTDNTFKDNAPWVDFVLGNPDQLDWFRDLLGTMAPMSVREAGLENDLAQLRKLPPFGYADIVVPTLMLAGSADKRMNGADLQAVAGKLPSASLVFVEGAGHLLHLGPQAEDVQKKIVDFLGRYSGGQSQP